MDFSLRLPQSVEKILARSIAELAPTRVVLFRSRSRGDHLPTSDFDLAFFGVTNLKSWTEFASEMAFDAPTLYELNVMRYEAVSPEMQTSILTEGKTLFESQDR